jgi:hypothetical protein
VHNLILFILKTTENNKFWRSKTNHIDEQAKLQSHFDNQGATVDVFNRRNQVVVTETLKKIRK